MFSSRRAAVCVRTAYSIDKTRLSKQLWRTAGPKVRRAHLWSRTPPPINYTLEQGAYITRRRFHKTNSLHSFIIYVRLAAEFEQLDTEVDETNQWMKDTQVILNVLMGCKTGCQSSWSRHSSSFQKVGGGPPIALGPSPRYPSCRTLARTAERPGRIIWEQT